MFSKWTEVTPCASPDAITVAKTLVREIFPRFGIPERMYHDNGTHFVNSIIQHLTKAMGIEMKHHCAYHPASAGLIERTNGTIMSKLKKAMEETEKTGFNVYH